MIQEINHLRAPEGPSRARKESFDTAVPSTRAFVCGMLILQ